MFSTSNDEARLRCDSRNFFPVIRDSIYRLLQWNYRVLSLQFIIDKVIRIASLVLLLSVNYTTSFGTQTGQIAKWNRTRYHNLIKLTSCVVVVVVAERAMASCKSSFFFFFLRLIRMHKVFNNVIVLINHCCYYFPASRPRTKNTRARVTHVRTFNGWEIMIRFFVSRLGNTIG